MKNESKIKILNITQHPATAEQIEQGVRCPHWDSVGSKKIKDLLTFSSLPTREEISKRAEGLAEIADFFRASVGLDAAMIGGAPYLMSALEHALRQRGIIPVYAFSERESVESVIDGKTVKTSIFAHKGFVGLPDDTKAEGWMEKILLQTQAGRRVD
jgi:hypothetical protein